MGNRRKIGFSVLIAVCVLALPGGFLYWWHIANLEPVVHIPTVKMPKPNAYDYYMRACKLIKDSKKIMWAEGNLKKPTDPPDPTNPDERYYTLQEKGALVRLNTTAISKLHEGFQYDCKCPQDKMLSGKSLDDWYACNQVIDLLSLKSQVEIALGDSDAAINSLLDIVRLGTDLSNGGQVMFFNHATLFSLIGFEHIPSLVARLDAQQCRRAAKRAEGIVSRQAPFVEVMIAEKWKGESDLAECFRGRFWRSELAVLTACDTDPQNGMNRLGSPVRLTDFTRAPECALQSKRRIMRAYISRVDAYIEHVKHPYSAEKPLPDSRTTYPHGVYEYYTETTRLNGLQNETQNGLLAIALSLRAYKLENGSYPDRLEKLVPEYLSKLPVEPFTMRGTFCYKPTHGKYLLYSVGPDGKDDGGKPICYNGGPVRSFRKAKKGDFVWGVNIR